MADMEARLIEFQEDFLNLKQSLKPITVNPPQSIKSTQQVLVAESGVSTQQVPIAERGNRTQQVQEAESGSNNSGDNNHNPTEEVAADKYEFQPLSEPDKSRGNKLLYSLKKTDMRHVKTLFIMDSNGNNVRDKQLDPDGDCKVIASGGLCFVGAVHGLEQYTRTHNNIRKLVYIIGTNDELHAEQHVPSERINYIKTLRAESLRVFPNAQVNLVLPFGGTKIDPSYIDALAKDVTSAKVGIKQFKGPNMHNKLSGDKLHMNADGKSLFRDFLRTRFVPNKQKPFSATSGRSNQGATSNTHTNENLHHASARPSEPRVVVPCVGDTGMNYKWPTTYNNPPPPPPRVQPQLAREIAEVVAQVMSSKVDRGGQVYQHGPSPYPPRWYY
jgi:hypothetical protein